MNRRTVLILFGLVVFIQLSVLAKMIWDSERVITKGTSYHFELQPIDPNDPFRGKYMTLRFDQSEFKTDTCQIPGGNQDVFVSVMKGNDGFAKITDVNPTKPQTEQDYFKVRAYCKPIHGLQSRTTMKQVDISHYSYVIQYPFDRYYMNEHTIAKAEDEVRLAMRDSTKLVYGVVMLKDGQSRLTSVEIDGVAIGGDQ